MRISVAANKRVPRLTPWAPRDRAAARPDVAEIGRRHADYYRTLAERADRALRGLDQDHWAGRLEVEADNLAAVAKIRQALGADRFDRGFAAGRRLNRREAMAAVHERT
jgi:hypothetical protein